MVAEYLRGLMSRPRRVERVEGSKAAGRVLAQPVRADEDQPPFTRSTRDGYACRAAELAAMAPLRVEGMTRAGEAPAGDLPEGAAWEIMTGAPVPVGADAVVMLEHVERSAEGIRLLSGRSLSAEDNVVRRGAQAQRGAELLAAGARLGAAQIAVASTCGYSTLEVYARPRVAILTTGDELVATEATPGPGQIRNSNAPMLAALVEGAGGEAWVLPTAADTAEALDETLDEALGRVGAGGVDLLLISGGVSAGKFDLVEPALTRIGARFHFTGVRIQPGKPLVFGEVEAAGGALPFFGLPGNPISSAATFLLFAAPVIAALGGSREQGPQFLAARLKVGTDRNTRLTRFLPGWCARSEDGDVPQVALVPWHGSGDLPAFGRSNCFVMVPEEPGLLEAGSLARILMV